MGRTRSHILVANWWHTLPSHWVKETIGQDPQADSDNLQEALYYKVLYLKVEVMTSDF